MQVRHMNDELQAAIRSGAKEFKVTSGVIDTPLIIPAGVRGFRLVGDGAKLSPAARFSKQAIQVGVMPQLHNNWMITGPSNIAVTEPLMKGDMVLLVAGDVPKGRAVLWDDSAVITAKGPDRNQVMHHAELVDVIGCHNGKVLLSEGVGREYSGRVWLAPYDAAVCSAITIEGIHWDGKALDGSVSQGLVAVGICDQVELRDLSAENVVSDAIMCNTSRRVNLMRCKVGGSVEGGAGTGYGFSFYRSRDVWATHCYAERLRHGFIMHSGSMNVRLQACKSLSGFDLHGFDERNIALVRCEGDGCDIGNDSWLAGADGVLIRECLFTDPEMPLGLHAGVRNVRVADSTLGGGIGLYSVEEEGALGVPSEGYADRIRVDRCAVNAPITVQGARRFGEFTMSGGSVGCYSTVLDIANQPVMGRMTFSKTAFESGPETTIQLRNQGPGFSLVMDLCKITTQARTGIWAADTFKGAATVRNCTFDAPAGATLLSDQSAGHVVAANNETTK